MTMPGMTSTWVRIRPSMSISAISVKSCGVLVPLYSFLNRIIRSVRPGTGFDISRYMLDGNINMTGINTALEGMIRAAFVGILFTLVCTALSMAVMTKRDIR